MTSAVTAADRYRAVTSCRVCGSSELDVFLSLGRTALANALRAPDDASPEPTFPLETALCARCGQVQLTVAVDPAMMFGTYRYLSSASEPSIRHFDALAAALVPSVVAPGALIVEVGSNDGVLLRPLAARGARVVGVEPAQDLAASADRAGLTTVNAFFGVPVARRVAAEHGRAAAVIANNVLAHIDDLAGFIDAMEELLGPDGIFVGEVPYLGDLLERVEYDTIYHEHLSYFAVAPLASLFGSRGWEIYDIERLPVHGGSIRMFVGRQGARPVRPLVNELCRTEAARGFRDRATFAHFATRVAASRDALSSLLAHVRADGTSLAGYGATAKGNTLLAYCGIGPEMLPFIADTTHAKHGLLTPGTRIPVVPEDVFVRERPDRALLLAWNYADAIVERHSGWIRSGGRFIHPIEARLLG